MNVKAFSPTFLQHFCCSLIEGCILVCQKLLYRLNNVIVTCYTVYHVGVLSVLGTSRSQTVLNLVNMGDVVAIHSHIQLQQTLQWMQCVQEHCLVTEALHVAACLASWSSMPLSVGVICCIIFLLLLNPFKDSLSL